MRNLLDYSPPLSSHIFPINHRYHPPPLPSPIIPSTINHLLFQSITDITHHPLPLTYHPINSQISPSNSLLTYHPNQSQISPTAPLLTYHPNQSHLSPTILPLPVIPINHRSHPSSPITYYPNQSHILLTNHPHL